jgi:crotonobetainyl-CoA:carnitine CoA-transferase CaiB-like acyl-CoA transferase
MQCMRELPEPASPKAAKTEPLNGIRVLDLTNVLSGPFCCHQLAFLGADVIKVEIPGTGDLARQLGADQELNENLMGVSFLAQNSGKRSLTVNLKSEAGKEVLKRLVETVDVLVENFRPGVMDRLGVGYSALKAIKPDLIYCAISGFGQDGPLRNLPAYDQIIQGMSGVMSITGSADTGPYRVGYPVADTIGGLTAAFSIAAARTGPTGKRGCLIDVSMLESTIATMGWVVSNYLVAGKIPQPGGNDNFTASPSGTFRTGDGLINIAANKQEQFEALCRIVDRADIITDERFAERQARLNNRTQLTEILEDALTRKPATEWRALFNDAGVPVGEVMSVADALSQAQVAERGMIGAFENVPGVGRDIHVARTGVKMDGQVPKTESPPPMLGQDTEAILKELGYSDTEIEKLREEKAV